MIQSELAQNVMGNGVDYMKIWNVQRHVLPYYLIAVEPAGCEQVPFATARQSEPVMSHPHVVSEMHRQDGTMQEEEELLRSRVERGVKLANCML